MEQVVYTIRAITNLHVGDIGSSVSIVDKSVQKDVVTGYPAIYATSLKGALRNAMEESGEQDEINAVFGYTKGSNASKGKYRFNDAYLLFYPVRSDHRPYYLAVSPVMLEQALQIMQIADDTKAIEIIDAFKALDQDKLYVSDTINEDVLVGDITVGWGQDTNDVTKKLLSLFNIPGKKDVLDEPGLLYLSDEHMSELLEQLPVVARNQLNNGISANLWYEELVPRKSVFITLISKEEPSEAFDNLLDGDGYAFQMGANATVGYGFSLMQKIRKEGDQT